MKELNKTKVTVRLRKAEFRKEWYVYIESYPVFVPGKKQPQRIREFFNRSVSTVEWDKKRTARTTDTSKTYKPKRDDNGIIICRSEEDRETMRFIDDVRKLRQREYDTTGLYSDTEAAQAEQKERLNQNFIEYFKGIIKKRSPHVSQSITFNWNRTLEFLKQHTGENLLFKEINNRFIEDFRLFLLSAPSGSAKGGTISQNTASNYFSIFKSALKQAFVDDYLTLDISAKIKSMQKQATRIEFLTVEELNAIVSTPCSNEVLKRAALFSALTGLRHSDIKKMKWKELQISGNQIRLNFDQKKTDGIEYMPIPEQALQLCGNPGKPEQYVFEGLPHTSSCGEPIKKWIQTAGITRRITFHCFRHTYATLQLAGGTDLYTVSKMLGHKDIQSTQIYAKVINETKQKATKTIKLNLSTDIPSTKF
jgi:integrase